MAHKVPFIVAELGADVDPFLLHIYSALAEKRARSHLAAHESRAGRTESRGKQLGGLRPKTALAMKAADDRAEALRPRSA